MANCSLETGFRQVCLRLRVAIIRHMKRKGVRMSDQNANGKATYEAPILVPLGAMAKGRGVNCAAGSNADPGYCEAGTTATPGYCTAGTSAATACTDAGVSAVTGNCSAGTFPGAGCTGGNTP